MESFVCLSCMQFTFCRSKYQKCSGCISMDLSRECKLCCLLLLDGISQVMTNTEKEQLGSCFILVTLLNNKPYCVLCIKTARLHRIARVLWQECLRTSKQRLREICVHLKHGFSERGTKHCQNNFKIAGSYYSYVARSTRFVKHDMVVLNPGAREWKGCRVSPPWWMVHSIRRCALSPDKRLPHLAVEKGTHRSPLTPLFPV